MEYSSKIIFGSNFVCLFEGSIDFELDTQQYFQTLIDIFQLFQLIFLSFQIKSNAFPDLKIALSAGTQMPIFPLLSTLCNVLQSFRLSRILHSMYLCPFTRYIFHRFSCFRKQYKFSCKNILVSKNHECQSIKDSTPLYKSKKSA